MAEFLPESNKADFILNVFKCELSSLRSEYIWIQSKFLSDNFTLSASHEPSSAARETF
jgi:hypothetical protein